MNLREPFGSVTPEAPVIDDDIAFLKNATLAPPANAEIAEVNARQRNPFPKIEPIHNAYHPFNPSPWEIPQMEFPVSFVGFLRWSKGRPFVSGDREFGIFSPKSHRLHLLC